MHHSQDSLPQEILQSMNEHCEKLGATGRFPDGKLTDTDEGEIRFTVAGDTENNLVHIDFGEKPIAFVSMTPEEAVGVAQLLIKNARSVATKPLRIELY